MNKKIIYCPNCSEWVTTLEVTIDGDIKLVLKELIKEFNLELFTSKGDKIKNIDNLILIPRNGYYTFREAINKKDLVLSNIMRDINERGYGLYLKNSIGKLYINYNSGVGLYLSADEGTDEAELVREIADSRNIIIRESSEMR